jgi:mannose-6-phosphate isomerase-like protein (cupin superfamily)
MSLFNTIEADLLHHKLQIESVNQNRPWGGFFVIEEADAQRFSDVYFEGLDVESLRMAGKLSPKILLVKPQARLSWQYHNRRAETWRIIKGPVGVVRSFDDSEYPVKSFKEGETITLKKGERHRLIGFETWGVVAEFWQHTDPTKPSNEEDIIRLQDDYSRA